MTEQVQPEGGSMPLENASQPTPPVDTEAKGGSEAEPSAAPESEKPAKPQKSGEQIRIDELTRRLRESERRSERLLRLHEDRAQAPTPQAQQPAAEPDKPKALKDFGYDETKFAEYLIERASTTAVNAAKRAEAAAQAEASDATRRQTWDERFEKFAETNPDILDGWDEVPISHGMGRALQGSEVGPEIGLYLKNNRDVAKQLSKLDSVDAAREIGRIEERLAVERKKAAEKPVSKAPAPPPKIDGSGESSSRVSTTSPDSDAMTDDEWVKAEQARVKRKQQRREAG